MGLGGGAQAAGPEPACSLQPMALLTAHLAPRPAEPPGTHHQPGMAVLSPGGTLARGRLLWVEPPGPTSVPVIRRRAVCCCPRPPTCSVFCGCSLSTWDSSPGNSQPAAGWGPLPSPALWNRDKPFPNTSPGQPPRSSHHSSHPPAPPPQALVLRKWGKQAVPCQGGHHPPLWRGPALGRWPRALLVGAELDAHQYSYRPAPRPPLRELPAFGELAGTAVPPPPGSKAWGWGPGSVPAGMRALTSPRLPPRLSLLPRGLGLLAALSAGLGVSDGGWQSPAALGWLGNAPSRPGSCSASSQAPRLGLLGAPMAQGPILLCWNHPQDCAWVSASQRDLLSLFEAGSGRYCPGTHQWASH